MRLDEYQWSHNPRGMHNNRAAHPFDVARLAKMRMGWAKIVAVDREFLNVIPQMLANNITPIVRVWRPRRHGGRSAQIAEAAPRAPVTAGVATSQPG